MSFFQAQIPQINDMNIGFLDCKAKDFNSAADTMEDIAALVEEIGFDKLVNDLGINLSF